jgi:acetyl-CoA carboxylase carboxyltransferase component
MEELSLSMKLPNIKLVDGSSGGGSVTTIRTSGFSYLPLVKTFSTVTKAINAGIPNLGAVVGPAIGLGAARVTACHFSVMAGDVGSLFNAGPNVVAGEIYITIPSPSSLPLELTDPIHDRFPQAQHSKRTSRSKN